jgi:putative effector of murein hydrolase
MKKYRQAILSWIVFILALGITEAIIFRVVNPLLVNILLWAGIPRDDLSRSTRFLVIWFAVFLVAIAYYLLLTRTVIGRKWIQWFMDANKTIFQKSK